MFLPRPGSRSLVTRPISLRPPQTPQRQSLLPNISHISLEKSTHSNYEQTPPELPLPLVTAKAWSICKAQNGECLWGKDQDARVEMASLTKMMTGYLSCLLAEKFQVNLEKTKINISRSMVTIGGTIAELKEGDQLSILELLYGLMLPSGNDCALALAAYFGGLLLRKFLRNAKSHIELTFEQMIRRFIKEMNSLAMRMALKSTTFANVHGLSHKGNKSTAVELGKLASHLMKNQVLREIIKTKIYTVDVYNFVNDKSRILVWRNTNKLLSVEGFSGIKTGTTPNAKACLTVYFSRQDVEMIITVLACSSTKHRWEETKVLSEWGFKNYQLKLARSVRKSLFSARTER